MDIKKIPIFSMVSNRLAWLSQRQKVLSHNLANADTPRFTPSDLKPLDFKQALDRQKTTGTGIAATNPAHFTHASEGSSAGSDNKVILEKDLYDTTVTGNSVSLEDQMVKMSDTVMNYELTLNLMKKYTAMYRESLGRR